MIMPHLTRVKLVDENHLDLRTQRPHSCRHAQKHRSCATTGLPTAEVIMTNDADPIR